MIYFEMKIASVRISCSIVTASSIVSMRINIFNFVVDDSILFEIMPLVAVKAAHFCLRVIKYLDQIDWMMYPIFSVCYFLFLCNGRV